MGALRHAEFCICPDCVDVPQVVYCDDTPKVVNGIVCTPEYVYLADNYEAWVYYVTSYDTVNDMTLSEWKSYPDFKKENNDVS